MDKNHNRAEVFVLNYSLVVVIYQQFLAVVLLNPKFKL